MDGSRSNTAPGPERVTEDRPLASGGRFRSPATEPPPAAVSTTVGATGADGLSRLVAGRPALSEPGRPARWTGLGGCRAASAGVGMADVGTLSVGANRTRDEAGWTADGHPDWTPGAEDTTARSGADGGTHHPASGR